MHREILQIADSVAREKGIDIEEVFLAMEEAIQKIGKLKYGQDRDIRASIDRKTGEMFLTRHREVVDVVEDSLCQMSLTEALASDPSAVLGGFIVDALPPVEFGRIAAQSARQIIGQRVRMAERKRQYDEFKEKEGEIVSGVVKRSEFGNYIIDLSKAEGYLRKDEVIPREVLRPGDRVRCYIRKVVHDVKGHQIFLSRTHPTFMAKLFAQEVPEVYEGAIEILSVARDPGSRAKIAVYSHDSTIDPVGACVGMRGSRIQSVVNELQGEKIDIVVWSQDMATYIVNALSPAEISKVVIDEEEGKVCVVVSDENLSLAIGRRGQNVRLATQLIGLDISILTEEQESEKRTEEMKGRVQHFMDAMNIDDVIAQLLVGEGFEHIEDIVEVGIEELSQVQGFDEALAQELKDRADQFVHDENERLEARIQELGIQEDLRNFEGMPKNVLVRIAEKGIKTLDDFADLATDELREIVGEQALSKETAEDLIMRARAHWFKDE